MRIFRILTVLLVALALAGCAVVSRPNVELIGSGQVGQQGGALCRF